MYRVVHGTIYFYPRSPCGERPPRGDFRYLDNIISIHALLAESDPIKPAKVGINFIFLSTLSLRRATTTGNTKTSHARFLSTLSLRRATIMQIIHSGLYGNFYPRSPCGERRYPVQSVTPCTSYFYPRSPCGERHCIAVNIGQCGKFLSTLSLRRATAHFASQIHSVGISIHALLAESDRLCTILYSCPGNFYPRSPCGERRKPRRLKSRRCVFLSTLSLRRATYNLIIHHAEKKYFYPRSPCGERQQTKTFKVSALRISIHALLAESDWLFRPFCS